MSGQVITCEINSKISISISAIDDSVDLDQQLYAINWFNLKRSWLYELYSKLAYPHVIKVGGSPLFKGKLIEKLEGENSYDREVLLIVGYLNADSFLKMVSNKWFQIKSFLRLKAVREFNFGFARRIDNKQQPEASTPYRGNKVYLIHVMQDMTDDKPLFNNDLLELKTKEGTLFFSGKKAAVIGQTRKGGKLKNNPFFVERLLVWEGEDAKQLKQFVKSPEYLQIKSMSGKNNLYLFDRLV